MRDPLTLLRDARLARLVSRSQRGDREAFRDLDRELHGPPTVGEEAAQRLPHPAASPEELEQARQRVIEELRRTEGEGTQIDLEIEPGSEGNRVRLKVRKKIEQ